VRQQPGGGRRLRGDGQPDDRRAGEAAQPADGGGTQLRGTRERGHGLDRVASIGVGATGERDRAAELLATALRQDTGIRHSLDATVAAAYLLISGSGDVDTTFRLLSAAIEARPPAETGHAALDRVVRDAGSGGAIVWAILALDLLAADSFRAGHWDLAAEQAAESLRLCQEHGCDSW
jgi:hypothetical protein